MAQEKNTNERYSEAVDIGTVKIADDVVALIAAFAAMEVEGVSGMAGTLSTAAAFRRPAARCRTESALRSRI